MISKTVSDIAPEANPLIAVLPFPVMQHPHNLSDQPGSSFLAQKPGG